MLRVLLMTFEVFCLYAGPIMFTAFVAVAAFDIIDKRH